MSGPLDQLSEPLPRSPAPRASGPGERRARLQSLALAAISTAVVLGLLVWVVVNAPGWDRVRESFLDGENFVASAPKIVIKFGTNIALFLIAEVLILGLALVLAVLRSLPGPVLFPLRLLATIYVDVFRALPGVLVIYVLGFGIPGLRLPGVPIDPFFWGVVALTLLYSAYVSEVYRAGIESVHPSQAAAARSLGLSQLQALRYVVLPQAVRNMLPVLLTQSIVMLQDTSLVYVVGLRDFLTSADIVASRDNRPTELYLFVAIVFLIVCFSLSRVVNQLRRRYTL